MMDGYNSKVEGGILVVCIQFEGQALICLMKYVYPLYFFLSAHRQFLIHFMLDCCLIYRFHISTRTSNGSRLSVVTLSKVIVAEDEDEHPVLLLLKCTLFLNREYLLLHIPVIIRIYIILRFTFMKSSSLHEMEN